METQPTKKEIKALEKEIATNSFNKEDSNMAYLSATQAIISTDTDNREKAQKLLDAIKQRENALLREGYTRSFKCIDTRTFKEVWAEPVLA